MTALKEHWFWSLLTAAALLWYSTITVFVSVRGLADIRTMLRRLREQGAGHVPERGGEGK